MKFREIVIYNWYDNIISAFCTTNENIIFYCNLLVGDDHLREKIYVCIELKYFVQGDLIFSIIKNSSYHTNKEVLQKVLNNISLRNESFLIKTDNLQTGDLKIMKYKSDFNWNHNFFSIDYPIGLGVSAKLDNWWGYF